jgi:hypothetical protein
MSVARCARVSYDNHDGTKSNLTKDLELYQMLHEENHCFISGTEVLTETGYKKLDELIPLVKNGIKIKVANIDENTLEFVSWYELQTKDVHVFKEDDWSLQYVYPSINYGITSNHTMFGSIVSTQNNRFHYTHSKFKPSDLTSNYASKPTKGEQEMLVPKVCKYTVKNTHKELVGKLIGFYIGDGFVSSNTTRRFRLVKERKIEYVSKLLQNLDSLFTKSEKDAYNLLNDFNNFKKSNIDFKKYLELVHK